MYLSIWRQDSLRKAANHRFGETEILRKYVSIMLLNSRGGIINTSTLVPSLGAFTGVDSAPSSPPFEATETLLFRGGILDNDGDRDGFRTNQYMRYDLKTLLQILQERKVQ